MTHSWVSKFVAIIFFFRIDNSLVLEFVDWTVYENHENWHPAKIMPFTVIRFVNHTETLGITVLEKIATCTALMHNWCVRHHEISMYGLMQMYIFSKYILYAALNSPPALFSPYRVLKLIHPVFNSPTP